MDATVWAGTDKKQLGIRVGAANRALLQHVVEAGCRRDGWTTPPFQLESGLLEGLSGVQGWARRIH
jgi:hypothetical protein